jgi:DNA uptake protein ComE-like DNA-binding protein
MVTVTSDKDLAALKNRLKVKINKATLEQLALLPGIGNIPAQKILAYRKNMTISKLKQIL